MRSYTQRGHLRVAETIKVEKWLLSNAYFVPRPAPVGKLQFWSIINSDLRLVTFYFSEHHL